MCCDTSTAEFNTTALSPPWAGCEKIEENRAGMSVRLICLSCGRPEVHKADDCLQEAEVVCAGWAHSTAVLINWVTPFLFFLERV